MFTATMSGNEHALPVWENKGAGFYQNENLPPVSAYMGPPSIGQNGNTQPPLEGNDPNAETVTATPAGFIPVDPQMENVQATSGHSQRPTDLKRKLETEITCGRCGKSRPEIPGAHEPNTCQPCSEKRSVRRYQRKTMNEENNPAIPKKARVGQTAIDAPTAEGEASKSCLIHKKTRLGI